MSHFSAWMGAGVVTAGVSAAMIIGADVASAETGPDSSPDSTASSSDGDRTRPSPSQDASDNDASEKSPVTDSDNGIDDDDAHDESALDADETQNEIDIVTGTANGQDADDTADSDISAVESPKPDVTDLQAEKPLVSEAEEDGLPLGEGPAFVESYSDGNDTAAKRQAPNVTPAAATTLAAAIAPSASTTAAVAPQQSLQDIITSFIFDFVGVAVTFIAGPPVVPRGSSVTVSTSTLKIDDQHTVPAHWYYPKGDEPPQRIIYLQHGFLGVGAMYSYTAANLAETTNSIVVVPTLTSNRNVADGFWLGSDQALRATSALFVGNRKALTDSAIAAGYAQRYGAEFALPERFALVGHSLGGNLVAGAAGYYADAVVAGGVANQLAGVVLLDAAPQGSVLSDALVKLDGVGTYIPVFELGAPKEFRQVDAALNEHRPGRFNGLVLENGKHLDSMDGGTWLIQFVSHVYQGFPTAQNQAAAQTIIGGWVGDILDGRIDPLTGRCDDAECGGIYGGLGQTLDLDTPAGPTRGAVIGIPVPVRSTEFQPESVTAMVAPRSATGRALLLRT